MPKFIYRFEETHDESHPWEARLLQAAAARLGVSSPQVVPIPPQGRAAEASALQGTNHSGDRPTARQGLSAWGERDGLAHCCQSPG